MTDPVKLTHLVRSMYSGDMSAITWEKLADMKPMPLGAFGPTLLHDHCRRFALDRRARMERVSKMDLWQQCQHYRELGYFKQGDQYVQSN